MQPTSRKSAKPAARPSNARATRAHGQATRQHLLDIAGQVFAERGFADGTTKAIAERAGTPMASINYHFGSRDALYEAVLVEAHGQLVGIEQLQALTQQFDDPRENLRALLTHVVGLATSTSPPWGVRVMLREIMSPSALVPALVQKAVLPKAQLVLGLLGRILRLPPEDPVVQRAAVMCILPGLVMLIAPRQIIGKVLPAVTSDPQALVDDLCRYVLAGLDAIALAHASTKKPRTRMKGG
ncbi:TetR/AcrR family transcriptional regulator [Variovorax sp. dw_954]|uniref:TetR/AcrR family transcriptional regulator n=1 Tax=Variovorax sp. dw_954 TaxID=2720078 RepID=UPI001BD4CEA3|nr:TetR/AcrR family transcriptional regulator [Variovorax sp. dw_954]